MRKLLAALVLGLALAGGVAPSAYAQAAPSQVQYESLMRWAGETQRIIVLMTNPLSELPEYGSENTEAARLNWILRSRQWAPAYRASLAEARSALESLGPPPELGEMSRPYMNQAARLPDMLRGLEEFVARYEGTVAAVERQDTNALRDANASLLDAQIIVSTQFRDTNETIAASLAVDHPQYHLLMAFARSYDASVAVARVRRAAIFGTPSNRAQSADLVAIAAAQMRRAAEEGRASAIALQQRVRATTPATDQEHDFNRRFDQALGTYDASFAREEQIAAEYEAVVQLLRGSGAFSDIEYEIVQRLIRAGDLDLQRMPDIQRRTRLIQNM